MRLWLAPIFVIVLASPSWAATSADSRAFSWFAAMAALALVVAGLAATRGYRRFGILAGLFVLGSAGRLTLLRDIWFPAIDPFPLSILVMCGISALLLQAGVTAMFLWQYRSAGLRALARPAPALKTLILLIILSLLSVSPTVYVAYGSLFSYGVQLTIGLCMAMLQLGTLGALLLVPGPSLPRLPGFLSPLAAAFIALIVASTLAILAFEGIPHVGDDLTYLFQARTFAGGHLSVPAPPEALHPGLEYYLLDFQNGRWIGTTAPGWPAILTLGVLAGVPWLVNPALTALSILLSFDLIRRASGDRRLAALVAWLMACSPWVLATGASLMTHASSLFMLLLAWWCLVNGGVLREGKRGTLSIGWAIAGGLAMGWLFTTRQFEGFVLGGITGFGILLLRPIPWRSAFAYGAGCVVTGLVYFAFNYALTGNPLEAPLAEYLERIWPENSNGFGFGADRGPPGGSWGALDFRPGHTAFEGAINTLNGFAALNLEALGWASGSALAAGLMLFGRGTWARQPGALFLLVCFVAVVVGLFFYWFAGTFYIGPRYWYIVSLPVFLASAAGLSCFADRIGSDFGSKVPALVGLLCLTGLLVFTPWRGATKYYQFRENYNWLSKAAFENDLVFVSLDGDMEAALVLNDPYLPSDKPIFLRDLGPSANAAAAAAYPDRGTRLVRLGPDGWEPVE